MNPSHRPTKYKKEYHKLVYHYSLLGATDEEMATFLDVSKRTFNYWKKRHPSFLHSIKKGKTEADAKVSQSLYHRAIGYSHKDTYFSTYQGKIISEDIIKYYPPDPTAAIFWLKNRQPDKWRDVKAVEMNANITNTHKFDKELNKLIGKKPDELIREINHSLSSN